MEEVKRKENKFSTGPVTGLILSLGLGFLIYFILNSINIASDWLDYGVIVSNAGTNPLYKFIWFIMNFTEAEFYAGFFASIGVILGGFVAWRLDVKNSKYRGFDVSYGSNLWPWVLASQLSSLFIAIFILDYTSLFATGDYTWLPTFITVVGAPPAIMLIYGPSLKALLTGSILGGLTGYPIAMWMGSTIIPTLEIPGVVANVFTMALTGIIIAAICKALPWMEKLPSKPHNRVEKSQEEIIKEMQNPTWSLRRVLADFSEAQFYGNEIAGLFVILGASLDWILNMNHGVNGAGVLPAIILSQFIGSSIGVFLYFNKYVEKGWYGTYVPVVSVGPACVLMFGANIGVAVLAGVMGGIIGPPLAEYFCDMLPEDYHPTIGNVTSMGVTTIIVAMVLKVIL